MPRMLARLAAAMTITASLALAPAAKAEDVVVFAAASLKNALDAIGTEWKKETGKTATMSYAASSALAKQIEAGAPAQIVISADLDWMHYLDERKLIKPDTWSNLLGNQIVLIAPAAEAQEIRIEPGFPLAQALRGGKLAMGNVQSVPAGKYGKAALEKLGVWGSVEADIVQAENVRVALSLVSRGEAALGIVYRTDALADKGVKVIGTFPEDSHPPIIYPIAELASSSDPDARALLAYLKSARARALFEAQGFVPLF